MPKFVVLHILHYIIESRLLEHSINKEYKLRRQRYESFSPIVVHTQPIFVMDNIQCDSKLLSGSSWPIIFESEISK
jgi:hypothetical protein